MSEQVVHAVPADLSALAWVADELRKTLETAHKALRRQVRELETAPERVEIDGSAAALQQARAQFHQGAGALDMVGQAEGARLLRASEQAVQRFAQRIHELDGAAVQTIERASFALLDFLRRRLAGKEVSPLALFPQYRDVQTLAGADRIHPADLWHADAQWQGAQVAEPLRRLGGEAAASGAVPCHPDADTRGRMEQCMLALLRGPVGPAAARMSQLFAGLAVGAARRQADRLAGVWSVAAGFFEAQAQGRLAVDVYGKRLTSRLLAQVRLAERGQDDVSDRLTQDLLFFCARALPGDDAAAPWLAAVRQAFALQDQAAIDYEKEALGRYDPALIPLARRRVEALKESWSAATAGQSGLAANLREQAAQVADAVRKLHPEGDHLAQALDAAVTHVADGSTVPGPGLAMEVATSLLCLDAALDDADIADASFGRHIQQLAERIDRARDGRSPGPIEPWMEDLYRRASDRQTMGSVVQELRASLAEVEQQLDKFNRNPRERELLIPVPAKLSAMRGVLSVLGLDHAGQAVVRMRDEVDTVLAQDADAAAEPGADTAAAARRLSEQAVGRLAANVGALGFLIDLLGVQPQLAKTLFRYDAASGRLETVMGRTDAPDVEAPAPAPAHPAAAPAAESPLIGQVQSLAQVAGDDGASKAELIHRLDDLAQQAVASDERSLAEAAKAARSALERSDGDDASALRHELAQAMSDYVAPAQVAAEPPPAAVSATATAEDDEMLEVFFEEAEEVIASARESLARLEEDAQHFESISTVRRAFHTLKGSSRMVGLRDFGEAAWACEQLYNARLAEAVIEAEPALRRFSVHVLAELERWVRALAARNASTFHSAPIVQAAHALRDGVDPGAAPFAIAPDPLPVPAPSPVDTPEPAVSAAPAVAEPPPADAFPPLQPFVLDLPMPVAASVAGAGTQESAHASIEHEAQDTQLLPDLHADFAATEVGDFDELDETDLPDVLEAAPDAPRLDASFDPGFDLELPTFIGEQPPLASLPEPPAPEEAQALDFSIDLGALDGPASPSGITERPPEPDAAHFDRVPESLDASPSFDALPTGLTAEPAANDAGIVAEPAPTQATTAFGTLAPGDHLPADEAENYKIVGPLRIGLGLFNIFLNEADEQSRRLCTALAEWALELPRPVGEEPVALAHSLAGNSATVGHAELSSLARRLEHALEASSSREVAPDEARLYGDVAEEIRRLLHQFAAGFLQSPLPALLARLDAFEAQFQPQVPAAGSAPAQEEALAGAAPAAGLPAPAMPVMPAAEELPAQPQAPAAIPLAFEPAPPAAIPESGLGGVRFSVLDDSVRPDTAANAVLPLSDIEPPDFARDLDVHDAIDPELFEIFADEANELLPTLAAHLRAWEESPAAQGEAFGALRALHTLKGSARLAGAMRLGELAHRLETAFEDRVGGRSATPPTMAMLHMGVDALSEEFQRLLKAPVVAEPGPEPAAGAGAEVAAQAPAVAPAAAEPVEPSPEPAVAEAAADAAAEAADVAPAPAAPPETGLRQMVPRTVAGHAGAAIDWGRFAVANPSRGARATVAAAASQATASVRVKAPLLDRLVNQAGEVSITRSRLESEVTQMRGSLRELTENLDRLRHQLRDIELQADTQIASRLEASRSASVEFDPLEMDRFTRFQELTRMMAESVNDVATVQRSLQQTVQAAEDEMAAQARLTRALSEDLLRARMVPFDALSERLYRVVRQAAKETAVQVRLNVEGSAIELDRSVLDRMAGAFEHLLRNAVVHGIESPEIRRAQDKDPVGTIEVSLAQQGNEVRIEIRDDGHGLDLPRIEARARRNGLLAADARPTDAELANMIFMPGFTTTEEVTELAGRGVGMDAVRTDVTALGGRIETASAPGRGTAFTLLLPLTTAVTRVVQLRCGDLDVAVPASLVEVVRRVPVDEIERAYATGVYRDGAADVPFFWLGALLQSGAQGVITGKTGSIVLVRSAEQRAALHLDQVIGNQEVVVKNLGPQLARLPGLAGMSLLATGEVVPIYNPVALAAVYGQRAGGEAAAALPPVVVPEAAEVRAPLVLVVDDSLTVRRVTQRLLAREGFRVTVAKDGLDALEQLEAERPAVMLTDIEMPRMDGFDLLRNVRHDPRWQDLPVIMITSRIAQKHRDLAEQLGADHYLGKPYDEERLISLIQEYVARSISV